jgi:hypothetical protein
MLAPTTSLLRDVTNENGARHPVQGWIVFSKGHLLTALLSSKRSWLQESSATTYMQVVDESTVHFGGSSHQEDATHGSKWGDGQTVRCKVAEH